MVANSLPDKSKAVDPILAISNKADYSQQADKKRRLSGDQSLGEKSLMTENPVWLISPKMNMPVLNSCLSSLDEVVATPSFNVNVIESACNKEFKLFDVINKSKYVSFIDSAFVSFGVIAISIGVYVQQYCKLREIERNSDFFYFNRLLKLKEKGKIKEKMGESEFSYEVLRAAAYFYPPDISEIARKRRRIFCWGKRRKALKELNDILREGGSREKTLNEIHRQIIQKVCNFLNPLDKGKGPDKFQACKGSNGWYVGLTNSYSEGFFSKVQGLIDKHKDDTEKANKEKNRDFIFPILSALGQSSFIYWILMFIFYFIPAAPVVTAAAISIIPLGIALLGVLPTLLIYNLHKAYHANKSSQQMDAAAIETEHKAMLEKKVAELNKRQMFIALIQEGKTTLGSVCLKKAPVMKDLQALVKKRRFIRFQVICMGFLDGCFLPFFGGWLFLDGIKVAITYASCSTAAMASFTPIGLVATAIIAFVTLSLGLFYGVCSARKANQVHKTRFDDLEDKITVLAKEAADTQVLNKSLRDYDRLLRRFSTSQPRWTKIKKVLSRALVIVKRLGTGSLVFRLVIWSPILAFALVPAATGIPAGFAAVLIAGTVIGALSAAVSYLAAYNLESKAGQAGRIVEHLVQFAQLDWLDKKKPLKSKESAQDSLVVRVANSNTEELVVINKTCDSVKEEQQFTSKDSLITEENASSPIGQATADIHIIETDLQNKTSPNSEGRSSVTQLFKKVVAQDESGISNAHACLKGLIMV
ncbi:MAG: hypothetical protein RLZZ225_337 [Pseudomonadota bacterium]|jgi:hypothetical protein